MPLDLKHLSRRALLQQSAAGFGLLGLRAMLAAEAAAPSPLAPKTPHFAPKAKRVIFLFMHGGPSSIDTFDPKPRLDRGQRQAGPVQARADVRRGLRARPDEVAVEVQAVRTERDRRSAICFRTSATLRRRPVRGPLHGRRRRRSRRRHAAVAHRRLLVQAAQHGLLGAVRARHGESGSARLRHHQARRSATAGRTTGARASCPATIRARRSATPT